MTIEQSAINEIQSGLFKKAPGEAKYFRLQSLIEKLIAKGKILPGQRLPADKSFADMLGISLGTVQKALINLQHEGVVTRAPRRGTVISDHLVHEDDIYVFRFRDPITHSLITPQVRMLSISDEHRDGPWCEFLETDNVVRFERMLRIDLEPPVYSEVFTSKKLVDDLTLNNPEKFHGTSVHRYLQIEHQLPTLRTQNKLHAGIFGETAQHHLMTAPGAIGIKWEICGFSHQDQPTTFQLIQIPPDHRPVEFRRNK